MKSLKQYAASAIEAENNMNESVLLTAGAVALAVGVTLLGTKAYNWLSLKGEERKTRRLRAKMERLNMLRDANNQDWDDFFNIASRLGDNSLEALLRSDPELMQAYQLIDKDEEIKSLQDQLARATSQKDQDSLLGQLRDKIAEKFNNKKAELLNKAAEKIQNM